MKKVEIFTTTIELDASNWLQAKHNERGADLIEIHFSTCVKDGLINYSIMLTAYERS